MDVIASFPGSFVCTQSRGEPGNTNPYPRIYTYKPFKAAYCVYFVHTKGNLRLKQGNNGTLYLIEGDIKKVRCNNIVEIFCPPYIPSRSHKGTVVILQSLQAPELAFSPHTSWYAHFV